jgi:hypothetical protein
VTDPQVGGLYTVMGTPQIYTGQGGADIGTQQATQAIREGREAAEVGQPGVVSEQAQRVAGVQPVPAPEALEDGEVYRSPNGQVGRWDASSGQFYPMTEEEVLQAAQDRLAVVDGQVPSLGLAQRPATERPDEQDLEARQVMAETAKTLAEAREAAARAEKMLQDDDAIDPDVVVTLGQSVSNMQDDKQRLLRRKREIENAGVDDVPLHAFGSGTSMEDTEAALRKWKQDQLKGIDERIAQMDEQIKQFRGMIERGAQGMGLGDDENTDEAS